MKFTLSWLKKFLQSDASLEQIAERLTMLGLEVEKLENKAQSLADFKVAEIIETMPHPKADKLQICQVRTEKSTIKVICGASNARAGIKVVLAEIGTIMPSGLKIKQSKIREVESFGMLCSASELGLSETESSGIIELPQEAIIGQPIAAYFGLDDPVIHINVTPNRADALGVYGIARDLAASGLGVLKNPIIPSLDKKFKADLILQNNDLATTSLLALYSIKNINNQTSPQWLQNLLTNIGVKTVSLVVDVTNYITYSFGQPMHAYDADKLTGKLTVGPLQQETEFKALNDQNYKLLPGDLVVEDEKQVQALAGIIGADYSACSKFTKNIILEAACFAPKEIARVGRRLQIDSQARYRFERSVDSNFTLQALAIAAQMIQEICGGEISELIISGKEKSSLKKIDFPKILLKQKVNIELDTRQMTEILTVLGLTVIDSGEKLVVTVPSWRADISLPEDIVEELTRIYGYDQIEEIALSVPILGKKILTKEQRRIFDLKRLLAANGYDEVISWSFTDEEKAKFFTNIDKKLRLQNPISSELGYMRPSLLPNLLKMAANNLNRSVADLSIFELGPVFTDTDSQVINHAAGIRLGAVSEKNSHETSRKYDVFDIKADIAAILAYAGLSIDKCQLKQDVPSYYHPTRSAAIMLGKNLLGYFGQLHPAILQEFAIDTVICGFELNINKLPISKDKYGKKAELVISNYQKTNRDYAFLVPIAQPVGEILNFITNLDKKLIRVVRLFDLYQGANIDPSKKSVACSVTIQADNRTLTETDINQLHQAIISGVINKFAGELRDGGSV